jgi:hypothetical protein
MDCCCEMEHAYSLSRRVAVSASQALLEEKYRRATAFGKYLDEHPDGGPLIDELKRQTCLYRIAIANVLSDRVPKEPRKRGRESANKG